MKKTKIAHIHVWDQDNKGDRSIVLAIQDVLHQTFEQLEITDFPVEVLKDFNQKDLDRINHADLIVFGGGGVFYRYFLPFNLKMIRGLKKPLIIFGVGYIREVGARALSVKERQSVTFLSKKACLLGVRENYTKRFLIKNGVSKNKISVIGDPAVFLQEQKTSFQLAEGIKIGLNLNYSGWLGFGKWREDILAAYRETAEYFQKKYGAKIYYLKHHSGEDKIYPDLKIKGLELVDLPIREQKKVYEGLDLVIGMMLHSCVLAFGAGTPEINVAYDLRNRNFARFIGHPELVVELAGLKDGELLARAKEVFENSDFYRSRFLKKKISIQKKQEDFVSSFKLLI